MANITLHNPTSEPLHWTFAGQAYRLNPGQRLTVDEPVAFAALKQHREAGQYTSRLHAFRGRTPVDPASLM